MTNRTENDALIDAVKDHVTTEAIYLGDTGDDELPQLLAVPKGMQLHDLKPFRDLRRTAPERRKGIAQHTTLDSFIEHTKRFADEDSAVFADDGAEPFLQTVFNYHRAGADGGARFCDHRAHYRFPVSDAWAAWNGLPEKVGQSAFAELLEDRIGDVLDPGAAGDSVRGFAEHLGFSLASPSRLLTLSRGLAIRSESKVVNKVSLSSGEAQLVYEETHTTKDGGPLDVPGGFALAIPVFRGGALYQVPARLRYRVRSGAVTWTVLLHRPERIFEDAFGEACAAVAKATGLPVFHGRPE